MGRTVSVSVIGVAAALVVSACAGPDETTGITGLEVEATGPGTYSLTWDEPAEVTVFASTSPQDPAETGQQVAEVDGESADLSDLEPGTRWYFEARDDAGNSTVVSTREFVLEGTHNTRDIGGYRTSDGKTVAWGQVFPRRQSQRAHPGRRGSTERSRCGHGGGLPRG